jgi:hypothetical protein
MVYEVNVVINSRNWYDSRIGVSDPVVFQNINYGIGADFDRSVSVVRQRFMQDWARRIIPNSVRQGLGLTDPAGVNDEIIVTQGYAVVGGRFVDVPAGTFIAGGGGESLGGSAFYYLVLKVTDFTEGDTRLTTDSEAFLAGSAVSGYTKNHNELVLEVCDRISGHLQKG